jgi:hypothetical protein
VLRRVDDWFPFGGQSLIVVARCPA